MVPLWKVQRELRRLGRQTLAIFSLAANTRRRDAYDKTKAETIHVETCAKSGGSRVAVFLVYSPNGLLPSHLHTLSHLAEKGFAPLLVVNHPLPEADRVKVRHLCWQIMVRPNEGYDFGGYRDAILHVLKQEVQPEALLVLNDSMWFPLRRDCTLLEEMLSWEAPMRGFNIHEKPQKQRFVSHVQSYMFMFGADLLASPEFRNYWRNLVFSNNKHVIVRRLEMQMTRHFRDLGFAVRSKFDGATVRDLVRGLDQDSLKRLVRDEAAMENRYVAGLMAHLRQNPDDDLPPEPVSTLIEANRLGGYLLKLPPELMFDTLDVPVLKKDRHQDYQVLREMIRVRGYLDRFDPVIAAEVESWDAPR